MKNVCHLIQKELKDYFTSPIAYIVIAFFLVGSSLYFMQDFFVDKQADMRKFFEVLPIIFIVLIPALTMRSWAEEKREGTIEILATMRFSQLQLVLGKFFATLILILFILFLTIPIPITLLRLGNPDLGVICASYLGAALVAAAYIAIGQLISINTENQIVSFILAFVVSGIFYLVGDQWFLKFIPSHLRIYSESLGLGSHFLSISRGLIDTRDLLYYLTIIIIVLFFTYKSFDRIRKSGK